MKPGMTKEVSSWRWAIKHCIVKTRRLELCLHALQAHANTLHELSNPAACIAGRASQRRRHEQLAARP